MMKTLVLMCGFTVLPLLLNAQTNAAASLTNAEPGTTIAAPVIGTPSSTTTNASAHMPLATEIFSDSGSFDPVARIAVFVDHVKVEYPEMTMTCGIMTAHVPEAGKIDSIVAERDVVIDAKDKEGRPVHATCGMAVYTYRVSNSATNETIELTKNPVVHSAMFNGTANSIVWDRINNTISYTRPHMIIEPKAKEPTNAAPSSATPKK